MAIPQQLHQLRPLFVTIADILTTIELRGLLAKADRSTLKHLVEISQNIAVHGSLRPSEGIWQQLKQTRNKNSIRKLIASNNITEWRQILCKNLNLVRLLAQSIVEIAPSSDEEDK